MQIIDLNQVMFSTMFAQLGSHTNAPIELSMFRHMALNVIRSLNIKFKNKYGNLVIAADHQHYWRKDQFPFYKAHRRKQREASDIDWTSVFEAFNTIKDDLRINFPYKYICVEGAEADDIVATLCYHVRDEDIMIISSDKDYKQLQILPHVNQYDPLNKKIIVESDPIEFLKMHILKGDAGDGIPNVASSDNTFVVGLRQSKVTKRVVDQYDQIQNDENNKYHRNYLRNQSLIDLTHIPEDIKLGIIEEYEKCEIPVRSNLRHYMMKHKLNNLMEKLNDF